MAPLLSGLDSPTTLYGLATGGMWKPGQVGPSHRVRCPLGQGFSVVEALMAIAGPFYGVQWLDTFEKLP